MPRRDSDLLARVRGPPRLRYSYSYSQCSSRSRSGSFESDALSVAYSDLDGSELLDADDLQLLKNQQQDGHETVRVTVRFRPLLPKEKSARSAWTVHANAATVEAASVAGQNARRRGVYAFDEVYDAQHSTRAIYDGLARSIARSALDGIHGSIFAYGQTSSGKTYTMQGTALRSTRRLTLKKENQVETEQDRRPEDSDGLVQLAVKDLFDEMARRSDVEYLVRVSYLEVYNETVKDLLVSPTAPAAKRRDSTVHIREHPVTGVFTDNSERVVTDARGVLQALKDGEKQRAVGVTRMNERSSRSHSIFRVVIESKTRLESPVLMEEDAGIERVRVGCLNFIDLAGSESARAVSSGGKRLAAESSNINRSLLALSRVVVALGSSKSSNQHDHINFRDSKLTRILQPSLSGAARVLFVCCASPAPAYIEDTRSTLKFASRAKRIKVNASVNEVVDQRARALMELARENQLLRHQLDALASASRDEMDAMEEHAARLRMRIVSLEAAAAAPAWTSSVVVAPVMAAAHKSREDRQPEVTGLEGANSPTDSGNQVLDTDLSDEEDTDTDSQLDSPTGSPLLVADAACPTCETLDDALEIAKTRELESYLRIEELEEQVALLQRQREEEFHEVSGVDKEADPATDSQCVVDVEDDELDETKALSGTEEGGVSSVVHASTLSLASAALLTLIVESLKKRSPTEALAIVVIAFLCTGVMLASFAWNVAAATL
jgi:centromeric protein E